MRENMSNDIVIIVHCNLPFMIWIIFPATFEMHPNIGSYRLSTHRHAVHKKFFPWSLLIFKIEHLAKITNFIHLYNKGSIFGITWYNKLMS